MAKYLDDNGLIYFRSKIKTWVASVLPTKTSDLTNDSHFVASTDVTNVVYLTQSAPHLRNV